MHYHPEIYTGALLSYHIDLSLIFFPSYDTLISRSTFDLNNCSIRSPSRRRGCACIRRGDPFAGERIARLWGGASFQVGFVLTLDEALRAGAIVRGMDIEEGSTRREHGSACQRKDPPVR